MSAPKHTQEPQEENILSILQFRFAPYWPLFIILAIISGVASYLYLKYTPPVYSAYSTMMIKDEKRGVNESKMEESLDFYQSNKVVENEIVVLSSKGLMEKVISNLNLYTEIKEETQWGLRSAYNTSPVKVIAQNPADLKRTEEIDLSVNATTNVVTVDGKSYPMNKFVTTPFGVLKFTKNDKANAAPQGALKLFLYNPESLASSYANRVSIPPNPKSSTVLTLYFQDESAYRAKDVLNELMNVYTINGLSEKDALAANTLATIEKRLTFVAKDLDSIERTIQQYKSQKGIVDISEQGKEFLRTVSDNERQATSINMQVSTLDQIERYVTSRNNKDGVAPATLGLNDRGLTSLVERLAEAEANQIKLRQTMGENSPQVVATQNEIDRLRPAILDNVRNQKASLQASKGDLARTNGMYNSMLRSLPSQERELLEISRQQVIKNNVYAFLLQKREETALSSSSATPDGKIIDVAASSFSPVSPNKTIGYLAGLIIAFAIGIFVVLAKEILSGKILFRQDIEKYTQLPIVAEIISVKGNAGIVVNQPDKVYISEQFRHLRAAMGLYGRVVTRKKLLVTSSIPGEGKSFIADNLAMSLALSGKKVILVDADIRGPKTSSTFNLYQKAGLANYLHNEVSLEEVIYPGGHDNLNVLAAGFTDENPTELLLNGKLPELFGKLEKLYDYVIVDTSPVDPVTDAYVLSEFCDRTLFVVRHGHTPKAIVKILDENNKIKGLKSMAIVFNGVKKRGFLKSSFGYGYGFGYEYVYKKAGKEKAANKTV
ncbi:capsular exopolysaccharide family [Cnuella takakiae]|uniref:non-specific protein-tyrosine kinase n=1 Tax=Cnuella takakiae TaxID=1302690 RepID=A0A1M4YED3_9BACT|nr:polysaccharide biosynthesis tyrosine autokinase [Cnuella takakiae]OLY93120.1 hypothetical protein BUE76_15405 [Cnuella takakiae]SHF03832.1 capsular exopolysaccharide family [Cnuella takakiae]